MNEVEIIDAPETGLIAQVSDLEVDQETRIALCKSFEPLYKQASEWAEQANAINVTSVDDKEGMKASRELRLNLKGLRVDADKLHKKLKEDSLRRGRAIDGFRNIVKALVSQSRNDFRSRKTLQSANAKSRLDAYRKNGPHCWMNATSNTHT